MGAGAPVPVFGAQGQPAQLIPVSDGNFADLASQLKPGQQLQGRVAEVMADGKAIVNFRGIFVTAALKGVELARGEVISVMVKNLGNDPTFQIVRPVPAPALAQAQAKLDRATDGILRELGLPRDEFHGTLVRLMQDYGISPAREAVAAVKDIIARLPDQLESPVPTGQAREAGAAAASSARGPAVPPGLNQPAVSGDFQAPSREQSAVGSELKMPPAPEAASGRLRPEAPPSARGLPAVEAAVNGARPAMLSGRAVETAVFLYSAGLPAHREVARAAFDYLFGEPRLPDLLVSFERTGEALLADRRLPAGISDVLGRALAAARRVMVDPAQSGLPDQLRSLVENLGLGHEARLARAAELSARSAPAARPAVQGSEAAAAQLGLEQARETLKAALLELQAGIERTGAGSLPAPAREPVESLERTGGELLRAIQAQQVGNFALQDAANSVWVQIPLVPGAELRGGEMQVSWKRDREGRRRDPRAPAQMKMHIETRALGRVNVSMRLVGSSLAVAIGVQERTVRDFLAAELPGLEERLAGGSFRLERCVCELVEVQDEAPARPVVPTSSLDLKA